MSLSLQQRILALTQKHWAHMAKRENQITRLSSASDIEEILDSDMPLIRSMATFTLSELWRLNLTTPKAPDEKEKNPQKRPR